jgi:DNA-binding transcriptional ArsR family regulator
MTDTARRLDEPEPDELLELQASAAAAAQLMKLLSSEQRLLLLCRLIEGECPVGELSDYVRLAPSATSQHLAKLRAEGVVATRREGQTIYYRIGDPKAVRVIDTLCDLYRKKR